MAISSHDNVARDDETTFRHYLMADTLLQNGDVLLLCECADVSVQRCCRDSCRRYNVIEDNMRPARIEDTPTTLLAQLAKRLNGKRGGRIMAHHMINICHDRFALRYSVTQLITKDFFG